MIARKMVGLLDEYIPIIKGSEINDDPLKPLSRFGKEQIEQHGDDTPIEWLHRDERFSEKLATPDVSVADLIGDVDPIKALTENAISCRDFETKSYSSINNEVILNK